MVKTFVFGSVFILLSREDPPESLGHGIQEKFLFIGKSGTHRQTKFESQSRIRCIGL